MQIRHHKLNRLPFIKAFPGGNPVFSEAGGGRRDPHFPAPGKPSFRARLLVCFAMLALPLGHANAQESVTPRDVFSTPPDTSHPSRPAIPADYSPWVSGPASAGAPLIFVADPVVNNTVLNFLNTDTQGGSEPSIAVNPANPNQIVMTSFSGGWTPAPLWYSTNGGLTWTKQFTIPLPPGDPGGGPNDQTVDYGRSGYLYGTFLSCTSSTACNIYSGQSINPGCS